MIKSSPKSLFVLFGLLCLTFGCNDEEFFELENPPEFPWQSILEFDKAPTGAYYGLTGNGGNRSIFGHGRITGEVYADGVQIADPAFGFQPNEDVVQMFQRNTTDDQVPFFDNGIFRSGYFAVGFANGALDFFYAPGNDGMPFPDAGEENNHRIGGELHFIRAYAYYWLVRTYSPVYPDDTPRLPFRTAQATNFDEAIESELASTNQIYELILEDLQRAKELLPERYIDGVHPTVYADGRANRFAAAALRAKVLFHMQRYDEALEELNYVIEENGGDYDLSEEPIAAWNKTGVERGMETIWYYALWTGDGLGGRSNWKHPNRMALYNASNRDAGGAAANGARFLPTSDHFLRSVGWADEELNETEEALSDLRYRQLFVRFTPEEDTLSDPRSEFVPTRPYVWGDKYFKAGRRITNLPILRLADMVLLRAIIRAELGSSQDTEGARADLNLVRNRAGLDDFTGTDDELAAAIHTERFKEMAFEGDRLFYLQGIGAEIPASAGRPAAPARGAYYIGIPDFETEVNLAYQNN
jgi:tetratricopeptide (TPR) repeat protein